MCYQIACGEHFSVALSDQGQIYTTGSSMYGQLGNGETGEYFVTASKLDYANCNIFTLRNQFMERDPAQEFAGSSNDKLVPINEDIRIQHIACGKNHTLAVEANYEDDDDEPARLRVFSWGVRTMGFHAKRWILILSYLMYFCPFVLYSVVTMVFLVMECNKMSTILVKLRP